MKALIYSAKQYQMYNGLTHIEKEYNDIVCGDNLTSILTEFDKKRPTKYDMCGDVEREYIIRNIIVLEQ